MANKNSFLTLFNDISQTRSKWTKQLYQKAHLIIVKQRVTVETGKKSVMKTNAYVAEIDRLRTKIDAYRVSNISIIIVSVLRGQQYDYSTSFFLQNAMTTVAQLHSTTIVTTLTILFESTLISYQPFF